MAIICTDDQSSQYNGNAFGQSDRTGGEEQQEGVIGFAHVRLKRGRLTVDHVPEVEVTVVLCIRRFSWLPALSAQQSTASLEKGIVRVPVVRYYEVVKAGAAFAKLCCWNCSKSDQLEGKQERPIFFRKGKGT
jgi:hypothetical protein